MLYLIPTPLGNLEDITLRAVRLLRELPVLICEDTRTTKKLMTHLEIPYEGKRFLSLTGFTNDGQVAYFGELVAAGEVGIVSDAGTPGLSDPGKILVAKCVELNLPFTVLPGANALVPAVVASGFDTTHFRYYGFLPTKKWRQSLIKEIISADAPSFVYESVHRAQKCLEQFVELGFVGKVSVAREISKLHEQLVTGTIEEVMEMFKSGKIVEKGEFVIGFYPVLPKKKDLKKRGKDVEGEE